MDLSAVRFLIVDDSHELVQLLRAVLASWGASAIREANSVDQALQQFYAQGCDIIIMDQFLGSGDGLSLLRHIRHESPFPYVSVLMLTSHSRLKHVHEARDAGVNEFLRKPFTAKGLYEKLHAIIFRGRPFVRTGDYFGPDRRRRADDEFKGPERRQGAPIAFKPPAAI